MVRWGAYPERAPRAAVCDADESERARAHGPPARAVCVAYMCSVRARVCVVSLAPPPAPEAGMFALRERRIHVTQEDFEMAVAKVMKKDTDSDMSIKKLWK